MFSLQDGERDSKAVHGTSNIENRKGDAELEPGLGGRDLRGGDQASEYRQKIKLLESESSTFELQIEHVIAVWFSSNAAYLRFVAKA